MSVAVLLTELLKLVACIVVRSMQQLLCDICYAYAMQC